MTVSADPQILTAHAKINLALFLGELREDGRHELVTLFEPVALSDRLSVWAFASATSDTVVCAGVPGPNLVSDALAGLRAAGWDGPSLRIEIDKAIPVAAGMGGGSADAAALLRAAPRWAPVSAEGLRAIAVSLGADVPSQLGPGPVLGSGVGDVLWPVAPPAEHAVLVLPQRFGLATPDVYREADRLGLPRPGPELAARRSALESALAAGTALPDEVCRNDLEQAALSLRPELAGVLSAAVEAGADRAMICGSGPTVIGVFWGADGLVRATAAAASLRDRVPGAVAVPRVLG